MMLSSVDDSLKSSAGLAEKLQIRKARVGTRHFLPTFFTLELPYDPALPLYQVLTSVLRLAAVDSLIGCCRVTQALLRL